MDTSATGNLPDLGRQLVELASTMAELSRLSEQTGGTDPPSARPIQVWFDESFVYLTVPCPEATGSEADIFLGNGQAFLRIERKQRGTRPGWFGSDNQGFGFFPT